MLEIFYSPKENLLFGVTECQTKHGNVYEVKTEMYTAVQELRNVSSRELVSEFKVQFKPVPKCSLTFPGKKVFYVKCIENGIVRKDVQRLPGDWTMQKWLEN